jgi:hypothetical protein
MKTILSLKSSKAVSINSARHFHSSISISPGTRRIHADGRKHESKQRPRRHGQARRAHTEHPVRHVWPLRTLERSHRPLGGTARGYQELSAPFAILTTAGQTGARSYIHASALGVNAPSAALRAATFSVPDPDRCLVWQPGQVQVRPGGRTATRPAATALLQMCYVAGGGQLLSCVHSVRTMTV